MKHAYSLYTALLIVLATGLACATEPGDIEVSDAKTGKLESVMSHVPPAIAAVSKSTNGFTLNNSQAMPGLNIAPLTSVGVALLLSAVQQPPDRTLSKKEAQENHRKESMRKMAAEKNKSPSDHMRMLCAAMRLYHDAHRSFPPAYTLDAQGKPLLSWRVHLLPFLEQKELYDQFKLKEPWDSPHNKKLIAKMPDLFRSALSNPNNKGIVDANRTDLFRWPISEAKPGHTVYLAPQMQGAILQEPNDEHLIERAKRGRGISVREILDGTKLTIFFLEVDGKSAQIWTKPADLKVDPKQPAAALSTPYKRWISVGYAYGVAGKVSLKVKPKTWYMLFHRNDQGHPRDDPEYGEPVFYRVNR